MAGRKNSDNTQFGRASTDGTRAGGGAATLAGGDGAEPLLDLEGRQYVVSPGSTVPVGAPQLVQLGPAAAGFTGLSGRLLRVFGTINGLGFAQLFFDVSPTPGAQPSVLTQYLAPGNFEIDLSQNGGVQLTSGLGFGWSATRDTFTANGDSGVCWALMVA